MPTNEALQRLQQGNQRFLSNQSDPDAIRSVTHSRYSAKGQSPFAIIVGCSDSRVVPETLFDQGIGDLFVVRVAGNIITKEILGSVEFAAANFGSRLVVVLGHSSCGAVQATVDAVRSNQQAPSEGLQAIVDTIRDSVAGLGQGADGETVVEQTISANVANSVQALKTDSPILTDLIENDGLVVVGAVYSLETGEVEFFKDA